MGERDRCPPRASREIGLHQRLDFHPCTSLARFVVDTAADAADSLVSADRWEWFLTFCLSFGIWDVFYYIWLWVFLRWPPSLLTWDVLFLIPVPWVGPVLAPLLVSVALVVGSLLILRLKMQGMRIRFPALLWILAVTGGILILVSFTLDFQIALQQMEPPPFRWGLVAAGLTLSVVAVAFGVSRLTFPLNRRA